MDFYNSERALAFLQDDLFKMKMYLEMYHDQFCFECMLSVFSVGYESFLRHPTSNQKTLKTFKNQSVSSF